MPLEITEFKVYALWEKWQPKRESMQLALNYYNGDHVIKERAEKYVDGNTKTNRVTNWIEYGVELYVGGLTSTPYQVTRKDETADRQPVLDYENHVINNKLKSRDAENLRWSLICGYSVEIHSFIEGQIVIENDHPINWVPVFNSFGILVAAINKYQVPAGTIHKGEYRETPLEVLTIYDDLRIRSWSRAISADQKTGQENENTWTDELVFVHTYQRIPIIIGSVNRDMKTIISDALIGQNDEWNDIDSTSGDSVRFEVDALLKIKGYNAEWVKEHATEILEKKILALDEDGDADYISRKTDNERVNSKLKRTRDAIHLMLSVPDILEIVGSTGSTSGIALQLKFHAMLQKASSFISYLEYSVRDRIDLINIIRKRLRKQPIENYDVTVQFTLPVNRIEEWQNIKSLSGIVTRATQLKLLSDVNNPEAELKALEIEDLKSLSFSEAVELEGEK